MRSAKPLIALVAVLGGLLAYLYFVDAERPVGEVRDKVFDVEADAIRSLRIESAEGGTTALVKENDTWRMTEPAAAEADDTEVSGLVSSLTGLELQGVVEENAGNLEPYGLATPRVALSFTSGSSEQRRRLLVGSRTPTEGHVYAKRDDEPRVFLISAYLDSTFDRKPFDLRNKRVLSFDRDKVDRLELVRGQSRVEAVKSGLDWRITAPVQARADYSAIEGVISRLQSAQMTSVAAENAEGQLAKYGLTSPRAVATVGAGSTRATLEFGAAADGDDVYVRDASRPLVVRAARSVMDDVLKEAADLRRKDVFEFRAFNATRLEITRGSDTQVFEKQSGADDAAVWRRTAPAAGDVDSGKMDDLLSKLSSLRARSFADAGPKAPPALVVAARFDDGKKGERVTFVRAGDRVLATREDEAGAADLETQPFDEALAALDALK